MASTPKAAAAQTATGTAAPAPAGAFPPFDPSGFSSQLIWLALTFGFLYLALKKSLLPRITDVIEARQDGIARDLKQAEALKLETEQALAAYEKALAEAKAKAGDIARTTRNSLTAETDAERAKAEGELTKRIQAAEARIANSKSKAMATVNDAASDTVAAIVGKLTGTSVDKAEAAKVISALRR
jgi:F-type H+-transporting ATPase subunit b